MQEICIGRKSSITSSTKPGDVTSMVSHLSMDIEDYLEHRPLAMSASLDDLVKDECEQVVVKRDGKRHPPNIKKPIRKKIRDRERSGCSSSEEELERMGSQESLDGDSILKENGLIPIAVMDPPASPLVVETPIGSIKDRVKALQNKVEDEDVQRNTQVPKYDAKSSVPTRTVEGDMPELPKVPKSPKSPRSQTERLEETMSVRELMQAFERGKDPSKTKSGLFEHQAMSSYISRSLPESAHSEEIQMPEQSPQQETKSQIESQRSLVFQTDSDVKTNVKTENHMVTLKKDSPDKPQFISHSVGSGKTVKFADAVQVDEREVSPRGEAPELVEKESMSVKELMKTFETGQGPSETRASHISTSEKMLSTEQRSTHGPKLQKQIQNFTISHHEYEEEISNETGSKNQAVGFIKDNSEESQLMSDSAHTEKRTICDDGDKPELSSKESKSVKELLRTFTTEQDASDKGFQRKSSAPSVSTLKLQNNQTEKSQSTEQSQTQQSKLQTENLSFHEQSTVKICDETESAGQQVSLIRHRSDKSVLITDGSHTGKTVKFADTVHCDDGRVSPQREAPGFSGKDTLSVKELMKTFQNKQEGIQPSERDSTHEQNFTGSHQPGGVEVIQTEQSSTDICRTLDIEGHTLQLTRDNSEELQLVSDIPCLRDIVNVSDSESKFEDGSIITERKESSGRSTPRIHIEEPVIGFTGGLSNDISPDRRPSEDFSADIKAELEDSPEYQLFKRTSAEVDVSYRMESPDEDTLEDDSDTNPASISSPCLSYFGKHATENQAKYYDLSPESPKHEGLETSVYISSSYPIPRESASYDEDTQFYQMTDEMSIYSANREEMDSRTEKKHQDAIKQLSTQTESGIQEQQIHIHAEKNIYSHAATAVKDMSGMLTLLNRDLEQDLQAMPVGRRTPDVDMVKETFEQIVLTKDKEEETLTFGENKTAMGGATQRGDSVEEHSITKADEESRSDSEEPETPISSGLISAMSDRPKTPGAKIQRAIMQENVDVVQDTLTEGLPKQPYTTMKDMVSLPDSDLDKCPKGQQESLEENTQKPSGDEQEITVFEKSQDMKNELHKETHEQIQTDVSDIRDVTPGHELVTPFSKVHVEKMSHHLEFPTEKNTLSLLSNDLDQHLEKRTVTVHHQGEDLVHESCKQIILTGSDEEDVTDDETHEQMQTDVTEALKPTGSALETHSLESHIDRGAHQLSTPEKNMSGVSSLLSSDLDQQLQEKSGAAQQDKEEDLVYESCKQIILTDGDEEDTTEGETTEQMQTDVVEVKELTPKSELETPFKEVCIERKTHHQEFSTEKDMSGMLSLLSSDLDQDLEKSMPIQQSPEKALIRESCRQTILTGSDVEDTTEGEGHGQIQTDVVGELTPSSVLETPFSEVHTERKSHLLESTTEKDMSGMLTLLSADLEQHLEERTVTIHHQAEEGLVHESCQQFIMTGGDKEDTTEGETHEQMQTDVVETEVKKPTPKSELERPFKEVCIERRTHHREFSTEKDMSGMLSLLSSDLDQHLEKSMPIQQSPEKALIHESRRQTADDQIQTIVVDELTPLSVLETPFRKIHIERKSHHLESTTESNVSGMLPLVSTELDQHLEERTVTIHHQAEEDLVHDSCKQFIMTDSEEEDVTDGETDERKQTNISEAPKPVDYALETQFHEVQIDRSKHYQQSTTEKNMSGMLLLLGTDLDQHLKETSLAAQQDEEEHVVHESCKQIRLPGRDEENMTDVGACEQMQTDVGEKIMQSAKLETPFDEVHIERKSYHQESANEKNKSGMLSLLSNDLDQHLEERTVSLHHQAEDLVHESCKQIILRCSDEEDVTDDETHEQLQTNVTVFEKSQVGAGTDMKDEMHRETHEQIQTHVSEVKDVTPGHELATLFSEVHIERMSHHLESPTEKNTLSLLSNDLDQHLEERTVTVHHQGEDLLHESCKQIILTGSDEEDVTDDETHVQMQTDVTEALKPTGSALETPFHEVHIDRGAHQLSTPEKNMSGMSSLLSSDLDQHLQEKSGATQQDKEEDLVYESCTQIILTGGDEEDTTEGETTEQMQTDVVEVKELTPKSELETPFKEVCIERRTHHQVFSTEKDMSGMLSLLSSDLDQHLEKSMPIQQSPEKALIHESCRQTILTGSDVEDTTEGEGHGQIQTDVVGEPTPSSVLETLFSEVHTERKSHHLESRTEKDISGMLTLLSTDLDQYLKQRPVQIRCYSEEEPVHENCSQIILTEDTKRESPSFCLEVTNWGSEQQPLEGEQIRSHEGEHWKGLPYEESETESSQGPLAHDSDVVAGAHSYVEPNTFLQQPNTFSHTQRPAELENLHTALPDDPDKEPCHRDSLETSPIMEDASSKKSPDSIESSPTRESPCPDSLEGSPTETKAYEFTTVSKTAVYEDYASQLKACVGLDENLWVDESNHGESNRDLVQMESELEVDTFFTLAQRVTGGSMCSDPSIFNSENPHMLIRQDSLDEDDGDNLPEKFTPEEEMFIMAAKIKTFEEMEQEAKGAHSMNVNDRQRSSCITTSSKEAVDSKSDEPQRETEIHKDTCDNHFSSYVTDGHRIDDDEEVASPITGGSVTVSRPTAAEATGELYVIPLPPQGEEEEHMNLYLPESKTSDTKLDQTPSDERTPDPFQFQEGKLFEMTRGGAIDMTRSFDEEGQGYAFFHIGERPLVENVPEDMGDKLKSFESSNTTLEALDTSSLTHTTADTSLSENAESENFSTVGLCSPVGSLTTVQSGSEHFEIPGLDYLNTTIADLQSDISTVGHLVHPEQTHDSSDSSEEEEEEEEDDQCSVIEITLRKDSKPPLVKPGSTKQVCQSELELSTEESRMTELDQVQRKTQGLSTRTRSEADSDTSKAPSKNGRSYSDSSQSKPSPSDLPVMIPQKPVAQVAPCSPQVRDIRLSKTTETSSLDTDDVSSASHKSPDSVIFTYDVPASHSSDSDGNPMPAVSSSSATEDVFESRPVWDDTVETQVQRITDQTPECTSVDWQDDADRKEETLAIIADLLGFSWTELARELEFSEDDIQLVRTENPNSLQEQSHALLQHWVEREGKHATEDCLVKRLTKINRMDIVHLIETQMNKSVQEQTSRTYAEIEKTLDHSEVSVALSSVQDDTDSPRVVRRLESDRRPPPAVSEEDLSVASLLDIPSWAEAAGHTHSESMHGDLLEELEIPHELNPNLWTSEDIITQEPTCYDNSDEQEPTASSKTNLSEPSKQQSGVLGLSQVVPREIPSSADESNTGSMDKLESPLPFSFDVGEAQSESTLANQRESPQEQDNKLLFPGLVEPSSPSPDPLRQTDRDVPDDPSAVSSEASPTPPASGSPQLDQLLSELEEMKLKFRPETLDLPLSGSSDGSSEGNEMYTFEDFTPEDQTPSEHSSSIIISVSSAVQLSEDSNSTNTAAIESDQLQTPNYDEAELAEPDETCARSSPGGNKDSSLGFDQVKESSPSPTSHIDQAGKYAEYSNETFSQSNVPEKKPPEEETSGIYHNEEEHELIKLCSDSKSMSDKSLPQSIPDQIPLIWKEAHVKHEDSSSPSLPDVTPETVTTSRHFNLEQLMPHPSTGNAETFLEEAMPWISGQDSEGSLTSEDEDYFACQPSSVRHKTEIASSTFDEEDSVPPEYSECFSTCTTAMPPVLNSGTDSSAFEYSDPESYFDCKQAASEFSETECDESKRGSRSAGDHLNQPVLEKRNQRVLLSSGSEDYEDASLACEPLHSAHGHTKEVQRYSETSHEEFTLSEASHPPPAYKCWPYDDTDKSLARADEMPELPPQSVTEEKYKDENGHIVVKKVTRKIIRKCVSADDKEEVPVDGAPQGATSLAEGHGYSKVVKRTVLKSEGDHTEVTFTEREASASGQEADEGRRVSHVERRVVVEGRRTMTHQGDPSFASDLPSARADFKQALSYISGFNGTELPRVVERETVNEDGTVVRRAHMREGHILKRTAVEGAGRREQVVPQKMASARRGSKPRDLQQHLHQLFHRFYDEDEDEEEKGRDETRTVTRSRRRRKTRRRCNPPPPPPPDLKPPLNPMH
ncbi:ankyrin-2 isoform X2 [Betta splendens]|uniref:Ankyrin-2 isoform X2 n=1 Tax=Betta splendens TaxID=158456 RepID=A0A9W2XTC9_BETSP|nr:ankyrin-2 isoform X2 [Betta splendens]